jgi:hypothetical protein
MTIDTKAVVRREVRLATLDDLLREGERLASAERDGRLVVKGNWSLGQMLGHLSAWVNYAYDGYPTGFTPPPWILRMVLKLMKSKFLTQKLPVGFRMRGAKDGTFGTEVIPTADGLQRLNAAVARLKKGAPSKPNPVFGQMTPEEWIAITLRHGELHCGFFDEE